MNRPGKRLACVLAGVVVQVPALLLLLRETFDMHNRFSVLLSLTLPYVAIADRMKSPPSAVMAAVAILTFVQFPLYGAILGQSWYKGRPIAAVAGMTLLHGSAAAVALSMKAMHT